MSPSASGAVNVLGISELPYHVILSIFSRKEEGGKSGKMASPEAAAM
jgi:hypothetical protein